VTIGGSTIPPSTDSPVQPQGTPTATPTGSLPVTGSSRVWAFLGMALFCVGVVLACVPHRRPVERG
jgi:hypothetical protein